ncbi:trehalase family glycosidase [Robertkochia sediminum]|uniref:trehalase family glycosidase n=1 Tax=Robertkochia sediminum TaxID=2785326 RepID=UPI0019312D21|nr:trehalase family glycosidase [Robertkochia sediminum]MBL7471982.1 trehalase [Robertkochia sediminum]
MKIFLKFSLIALLLAVLHSCAEDKPYALEVVVDASLNALLDDEDTDGDKKITRDDEGDKTFELELTDGDTYTVATTYHLSNLLQELALQKADGVDTALIEVGRIEELPTQRISRNIKQVYWDDLTRTIDRKGLKRILEDSKSSDTITRRIYVPATDPAGQKYFESLALEFDNFKVEILPDSITPEYVKSINDKPGILSLKLDQGKGVPFVVPGGRFNEMYGWDSYFEGVGLIIDDRIDLARAMVDNFAYQIEHYGKILNANRTYYLTRSQPPFLTSYIRMVYDAMGVEDIDWLRGVVEAAIKEYETVWMTPGQRLTPNGLNRYYASGIGIPPETEEGHFDEVLSVFADRYNEARSAFEKKTLTVEAYAEAYQTGEILDPELDRYFLHDRSLRESGHDTSWRLDNVCADLNTVGLNALLYKYEKDFALLIHDHFGGTFESENGRTYTTGEWEDRAERRKKLMNKYMWDEEKGGFFDYNVLAGKRTDFESATNYIPLWSELATPEQAVVMLERLQATLVEHCGVASTSKESVAKYASNDVQRQWDYPNGWAPHQMMIWTGLRNYGFDEKAEELAYRWLWMITKNAVDYNGTIPEKYDVVSCTHKVYAEYGNVGTEFDYITTSGFGWMNASYQLGLEMISSELKEDLDALLPPEELF